ncbi:DNA-binding FrmR family transcriptional regulator [Acinetobacter calcoaceticus]|uniref:DNA-binding FrmR family transcriptional regulator n=1 Tax=Acinetobacter calcoaceticus TaxID=471 RepID=A0A4R1XVP7_ACICA|nr:DNA-binding FrmR family transcriptional regulator [Acinetobacter calcoaceticus]
MGHLQQDKKILNRVKRLQGQMRAIEENLQQDQHSCIDVLQQVAAVKGAVNGLMNELLELHLRHHVIADQDTINEVEVQEFLKLIKRYT